MLYDKLHCEQKRMLNTMCKYPDFNNSVELVLLNEIQSPYVYKRLGKCEYNTLFFSMKVYSYFTACRAGVPHSY